MGASYSVKLCGFNVSLADLCSRFVRRTQQDEAQTDIEAIARDVCSNADQAAPLSGYADFLNVVNFADTLVDPRRADSKTKLAGNQIAHLTSAFEYAAGSISAALVNSSQLAIHLAYYAELRACISLFASSGICVDNYRNFYLTGTAEKVRFFGGTHKIAWALWNQ